MSKLDHLTPQQKRELAKRLLAKKQALAAATLLERLQQWAQQTPDQLASTQPALSYAALLQAAQQRAATWQDLGFQPQSRVHLRNTDPAAWITDLVACLLCKANLLQIPPGFETAAEADGIADWRSQTAGNNASANTTSDSLLIWDGVHLHPIDTTTLARQLAFLAKLHPQQAVVMRFRPDHLLSNMLCLYLGGQLQCDPEHTSFSLTPDPGKAACYLGEDAAAQGLLALSHPACGGYCYVEKDGQPHTPAGLTLAVVDPQGNAVADRMQGHLTFKSDGPARASGFLVRRQGTRLLPLHNTQWLTFGGHSIERSLLADRIASANLHDHWWHCAGERLELYLVLQVGTALDQFAASMQTQLPSDWQPTLIPVSHIPRDGSGHVDLQALQQTCYVNDQELQRHSKQDTVLMRTPFFPSPTPFEWHEQIAKPSQTAQPQTASERIAYAKGAALQQPLPANLGAALLAATGKADAGISHVDRTGQPAFQSYAELYQEALQILAGLAAAGVAVGHSVMIMADDSRSYFSCLWACFLGGRVAVPAAVPKDLQADHLDMRKLVHAQAALGNVPIICRDSVKDQLDQADLWQIQPPFLTYEHLTTHAAAQPQPCDAQSAAIMFLTSGSTGVPKLVQQGHGQLLAMAAGTIAMNHFGPQHQTINWMPLDHVGAVAFLHVTPIVAAAAQVQVATHWIMQDPVRWLELIESHRAAVAWAPNFAYGLLNGMRNAIQQRVKDLSSMVFLVNAGEANVGRVMATFHSMLQPLGLPADAIRPAFGMSETCSGITWSRGFDPQVDGAATFISLGPPIPGAEVRIVDANNQLLKEGATGHMQLRGPSVTPGYFANPERNRQVFVGDGWFDSGDLGYISDGELVLTGREKDEIIVNGSNFAAHDLEAYLELHAPLEASYTAVLQTHQPEQLLVFCVAAEGQTGDAVFQTVRHALLQHASISPDAVVCLQPQQVPKTGIGKIQRAQLRERFAAGDYADVTYGWQQDQRLPRWFYTQAWRPVQVIAGSLQAATWWQPDQPVPPACEHLVIDLRQAAGDLVEVLLALDTLAQVSAKRISLITRAAFCEVQPNPNSAAVAAWFASWREERADLRADHLDLAAAPSHDEAAWVERFLAASNPPWVCRLHKQRLEIPLLQGLRLGETQSFWQPGVTYILAGGAGGLGRVLAQHIITKGCKVVLLGRRAPESLVDPLPTSAALQYRQADVLDPAAMAQVTASLKGPLGAIFQLAGSVVPQAIGALTRDAVAAQLQTRLQGTAALAEMAKQHQIPLLAFGSITAVFGFAGVSVYAAANAAMAASLATDEHCHVIDWSVWSEDGLNAGNAVDHLHDRYGFMPIPTAAGLRSLDYVLAQRIKRCTVGLASGHPAIRQLHISDDIDATRVLAFSESDRESEGVVADWRGREHRFDIQRLPSLPRLADGAIDTPALQDQQRPAASQAQYQPPTDALEEVITRVWCEILDQRRIGIDDHFFDVGGHSLQATRVISRLSQYFRIEFSVRQLFSAPTIRQLAKTLRKAEPKPGQLDKTIEIRQKIEAMKAP